MNIYQYLWTVPGLSVDSVFLAKPDRIPGTAYAIVENNGDPKLKEFYGDGRVMARGIRVALYGAKPPGPGTQYVNPAFEAMDEMYHAVKRADGIREDGTRIITEHPGLALKGIALSVPFPPVWEPDDNRPFASVTFSLTYLE